MKPKSEYGFEENIPEAVHDLRYLLIGVTGKKVPWNLFQTDISLVLWRETTWREKSFL